MNFSQNVQWRSEKFGAVIFDTLNEKVYVTNETGDEILRLLEQGLEPATVGEKMEGKYSGDRVQMESDVVRFVTELESLGLLAAKEEGER